MSIVSDSKEVVTGLRDLLAMIIPAIGEKDSDFRRSIMNLKNDAIDMAGEVGNSISQLLAALPDVGMNINLSDQEAKAQFRAEANLYQKTKCSLLLRRMEKIRARISDFAHDVEALYTCAERSRSLAQTAFQWHSLRRELDDMVAKDVSVRKQLEYMRDVAMKIRDELAGLK